MDQNERAVPDSGPTLGWRIGRRPPLKSLTGLRFGAAGLVFLFHVTLLNSPIPPFGAINPFSNKEFALNLANTFNRCGYVGVSFFFVLSGFVLSYSWTPGESVFAFLRRRLLKIFPNHLVTWACAMLLFAGVSTSRLGWMSSLFLVNSFLPFPDVYVAVNPPSWTLCSELLFYATFPLMIGPIWRMRLSLVKPAVLMSLLAMVLVQVATEYVVPATPRSPITPISVTQFWFGYIFPVPRLLEFLLGILLSRMVIQGIWRPVGMVPSFILLSVGYVAASFLPFVFSFSVATIIPVCMLVCEAAIVDLKGATSIWRSPFAVWLGEISFAFYLCQGITIFYARRLLGHENGFGLVNGTLTIVGFFLITLLSGWLLYRLVERPVMGRWARSSRRHMALESNLSRAGD